MDDGSKKTKVEAPAKAEATGKGKKAKAPKGTKPVKEPRPKTAPGEPMVVFAIRVPESERAALHEMAGSGKSTKLVRALIAAAISADAEAFKKLAVRATK